MSFKLLVLPVIVSLFLAACGGSDTRKSGSSRNSRTYLPSDSINSGNELPNSPKKNLPPKSDVLPCVDDPIALFDIACLFLPDQSNTYTRCKVRSQFKKRLTRYGTEIKDDSAPESSPKFEIECD